MYKQYCSFYDLSDKKSADSFPFHLEDHAKIWYNTIPDYLYLVPPEVVGIGSIAAGKEPGGGTNLTIDSLQNDCGVLSGVPGVAEDVDCSA
jgi:hypothetical protein